MHGCAGSNEAQGYAPVWTIHVVGSSAGRDVISMALLHSLPTVPVGGVRKGQKLGRVTLALQDLCPAPRIELRLGVSPSEQGEVWQSESQYASPVLLP